MLGSKFYCSPDASFNGNIQINKNASIYGTLTCSGDMFVGGPYFPATLRTGYITCYTDCSSHNFWGDNATIGTINTTYFSAYSCDLTGALHLNTGYPIVSSFTPGSSTMGYIYCYNSNWNGKVGYVITNNIVSPYGQGYANVNSMDFINNSGPANYSCWNFYALGDGTTNGYPTQATAFNTIYDGGFAHQSDQTIKQNVKNLNTLHSLDKITKIRLVNYQYIDVPNSQRIGVISQEIEQISPKATMMLPHKRDLSGNSIFKMAVNYNDLFIHGLAATQEIYKLVLDLQNQVIELKNEIALLKNPVAT